MTTPQGLGYAGTVVKQKLSPGFFTYQSGTTTYVAAVHLDGTLAGPAGPSSRPAVPGEVIEVYGTGFGPTNPASPASQLVSQRADDSRIHRVPRNGYLKTDRDLLLRNTGRV